MKSIVKGVFGVLLVCGLIAGAAWLQLQQVRAQPIPEPIPATVGIIFSAPTECEVGELVRLDATSSDVDDLEWLILPETPDFEVVGERAFFSARAGGEYLIVVAGAKGGQAFLTHHKIVVAPPDVPDLKLEFVVPEDDDAPPVDRAWRELTDSLERLDA